MIGLELIGFVLVGLGVLGVLIDYYSRIWIRYWGFGVCARTRPFLGGSPGWCACADVLGGIRTQGGEVSAGRYGILHQCYPFGGICKDGG